MDSVLIDTNLLVLLIVGATDKKLIEQHRRTEAFVTRDYDELYGLLKRIRQVLDHVALSGRDVERAQADEQQECSKCPETLAMLCSRTRESCLHKDQVLADGHFLRLGVADTGFMQKAERVNCSITVDVHFYLAISRLGRNVVNFNHVRAEYLIT